MAVLLFLSAAVAELDLAESKLAWLFILGRTGLETMSVSEIPFVLFDRS